MTDDDTSPSRDEQLLAAVCSEAHRLLGKIGGPVTYLSVRAGRHRVEISWDPTAAPAATEATAASPVAEAQPPAAETTDGYAVKAPLLGTFYRAPQPGSPPFVEEGDVIEPGQAVGIVEAMKIMNRIEAEQPGRVARILVGDGEMVEFGQDLMLLEPVDGG